VRKGLNEDNFKQDPEKKWDSYKGDALYGGFASFLNTFTKSVIYDSLL
jgi:hypothetical protein